MRFDGCVLVLGRLKYIAISLLVVYAYALIVYGSSVVSRGPVSTGAELALRKREAVAFATAKCLIELDRFPLGLKELKVIPRKRIDIEVLHSAFQTF